MPLERRPEGAPAEREPDSLASAVWESAVAESVRERGPSREEAHLAFPYPGAFPDAFRGASHQALAFPAEASSAFLAVASLEAASLASASRDILGTALVACLVALGTPASASPPALDTPEAQDIPALAFPGTERIEVAPVEELQQ